MRIQFITVQLLFCGIALAQSPQIGSGGIVNGADFQAGKAISPGSLVSIFGTQLATTTAHADSVPLSTSLGGVTVQFVTDSKTVDAPLLDTVASQLNVQVPWDLIPASTSATVNVVVTKGGVKSAPASVNVAPFSPALFASGGRAVAQNVDSSLAWPTGAVAGANAHPAKIGDPLILYVTGLGAVDSTPGNGAASTDKTRNTITKPVVMIGGVTAPVVFSGLSPQFVGLNQVNVTVPNVTPGDAVPIQLQIGGITTASLTIAVTQ